MARSKKVTEIQPLCIHDVENLGTISPNKKLVPINGKFTWHIDESILPSSLDKYKTIFAIEQSLKVWEQYLHPITFEPVGDIDKAQIVFRFRKKGAKDLPYPFGDGVLAYAFAPDGTSLDYHADVFCDVSWPWDEIHKAGSVWLKKVVVHEEGHCLNGSHSSDKQDIMFWQYQPNNEVNITKDTQQFIYDTYKEFGVKNPNKEEVNPQEPRTLSLKTLFKNKGDLARLSVDQMNVLNSFLNAGFTIKDKQQVKINKLYAAINR